MQGYIYFLQRLETLHPPSSILYILHKSSSRSNNALSHTPPITPQASQLFLSNHHSENSDPSGKFKQLDYLSSGGLTDLDRSQKQKQLSSRPVDTDERVHSEAIENELQTFQIRRLDPHALPVRLEAVDRIKPDFRIPFCASPKSEYSGL